MEIINRVNKTISDAGQRTRDVADIASLNNKINENNRRIKQLYTEIGEAYYNAHSEDADSSVLETVTEVHELKAQNEEWNDQIQKLRGFIKCPNCGEYVPDNTPYCTSCGHRLLADDVVVCPSCGKVLEKGMPFCQYCGSPLPQEPQNENNGNAPSVVICKCGNILPDDAQFCPKCGASREEILKETQEES